MHRLIGGVVAVASCACTMSAPARLYDLETGEVHELEFRYDGSGHGGVEGMLLNGERLKGDYSTVPEGTTAWGQLFAAGGASASFSAGSIDIMQRGRAILVGDRGTVLECEYVTSPQNHGYGVCEDNRGRRYRTIFE